MESDIEPWSFQNIFIDIEAKTNFIADVLTSFEQFPPEVNLNCDDFFSLFSLVCENVPYNFIVFICECVDPSISTGTLNSHRIAFGNFLLALPCCILYPTYIHQILTLFKASDSTKAGLISKNSFLTIIRNAYTTVGGKALENYIDEMKKQKEYEEKHKYDQDFFMKPDPSQIPLCLQNGPIKVDLPELQILDEVEISASELEEASIQTLFFVLWQKNQYLLQCKNMIRESFNPSEPQSREEYRSQASSDHQDDSLNKEQEEETKGGEENGEEEETKQFDKANQEKDENKETNEKDENKETNEKDENKETNEKDENKETNEKEENKKTAENDENKETNEKEENKKTAENDENKKTYEQDENKGNNKTNEKDMPTVDKKQKRVQILNPPSLDLGLSISRKDSNSNPNSSSKLSGSNSPAYDEEELVEADEEYQPRHSMV